MDFFKKFFLLLTITELRKKIMFVVGMLVLFRLGAAIPIPGVDAVQLKAFLEGNQFFGLLNIFSGGALDNLSIAMLGVGPYITASIIMQLLTMIFPRIKEMYQEEGEVGRRRFNQYARYLTVPLALVQAYGLLIILANQNILPNLSFFDYVTGMIVATAGSLLLMWMGEIISEQNIGNGLSLIIFAGIVSSIPSGIQQALATYDPAQFPAYLAFVAVSLVVVSAVVFITEGQRNIPVSYARRIRGNRVFGGVQTHLPLRVNQAGVIPIIFAISILLFPGMIGNFLINAGNPIVHGIAQFLVALFNNEAFYAVSYFLLVFIFTFFYTFVTFDPQQIADNVQKQGGFILGIRPGRPTVEYLYHIVNRITLVGGFFLGAIAVLPLLVTQFSELSAFTIGGTSLLIAVSVVLESKRQIEAQIVMREYENV
ncbi:MAG: preprotein translocase subunit SecY [Patescibacteria group bacterium]